MMKDQSDTRLYLDLMRRAVSNYIFLGGSEPYDGYFADSAPRYEHSEWRIPHCARPHTSLTRYQLEMIERLIVDTVRRGVPGDYLEAGVWRGGAVIYMRAVLEAYAIADRKVWAVDTFAGIPRTTTAVPLEDPVDQWPDRWSAGLDEVKQTFARYGLLDDRVGFVEGRFAEVEHPPFGPLALARLDADSYESTRDALELLYERVAPGGFVVIDDWHLPGCRAAVEDFRARNRIDAPIRLGPNAFWRVPFAT